MEVCLIVVWECCFQRREARAVVSLSSVQHQIQDFNSSHLLQLLTSFRRRTLDNFCVPKITLFNSHWVSNDPNFDTLINIDWLVSKTRKGCSNHWFLYTEELSLFLFAVQPFNQTSEVENLSVALPSQLQMHHMMNHWILLNCLISFLFGDLQKERYPGRLRYDSLLDLIDHCTVSVTILDVGQWYFDKKDVF